MTVTLFPTRRSRALRLCATVLSVSALGIALNVLPVSAAHAAGANANPVVLLKTSDGPITVELDAAKAPKTVANFVAYVKRGQYSGTIFHRVIPGFMIQGGGFDQALNQKPTQAPIALESQNGLHNVEGTIAMARTSDPDSATAQFFINTADNTRSLDFPGADGHGYAVFGHVTAGMDVVKKIEGTPTGQSNGMSDVPQTPIVIQSATLITR